MKKNNLDERQEQAMLHIEHVGCWLVFWGLFGAIILQVILYGFDFSRIGGEWIVFLALCLYMMAACIRKGLWDRRLKPNAKTNLIASLIAAVCFGLVLAAANWRRFPEKPVGVIVAGLISAAIVFVLCFVCLSIAARATRKKQQALEEEPEE